jgi:hypothetical protein
MCFLGSPSEKMSKTVTVRRTNCFTIHQAEIVHAAYCHVISVVVNLKALKKCSSGKMQSLWEEEKTYKSHGTWKKNHWTITVHSGNGRPHLYEIH